jgi:hypothetical protein
MDIIAWIMDPVQNEQEIENAYFGLLYQFADFLSYQLTLLGYPPRG